LQVLAASLCWLQETVLNYTMEHTADFSAVHVGQALAPAGAQLKVLLGLLCLTWYLWECWQGGPVTCWESCCQCAGSTLAPLPHLLQLLLPAQVLMSCLYQGLGLAGGQEGVLAVWGHKQSQVRDGTALLQLLEQLWQQQGGVSLLHAVEQQHPHVLLLWLLLPLRCDLSKPGSARHHALRSVGTIQVICEPAAAAAAAFLMRLHELRMRHHLDTHQQHSSSRRYISFERERGVQLSLTVTSVSS
jgi:hypothetical protein